MSHLFPSENFSTVAPQRSEYASAGEGGVTQTATGRQRHSQLFNAPFLYASSNQGTVNILSTTRYDVHGAGGRLASLVKMLHARYLELEDGGVRWRGFCFASSADQVSKAGWGYDVTVPVVGVFLSSAKVSIKASAIQVSSTSSVANRLLP